MVYSIQYDGLLLLVGCVSEEVEDYCHINILEEINIMFTMYAIV